MHKPFLVACKILLLVTSPRTRTVSILPKPQSILFYSSSPRHHQQHKRETQHSDSRPNANIKSPIGSPSRVQKLIASQSDPLLAKEIFDYASRQPNFQHSYSCYLILILKLGRAKYFSFIDDLLIDLKSKNYPVTPTLFSYIIKIYGEANLPDKALKIFYTILKEGRAMDACKVLDDMESNGCLPNLVSYRTLVGGLCDQGMFDEAKIHLEEMMLKGFSPHCAVSNALIKGFCNGGKIAEACGAVEELLKHGEAPHTETWVMMVSRICEVDDLQRIGETLDKVMKVELKGDTRIVEAGIGLEEYLIKRIQQKAWRG
ncbi:TETRATRICOPEPTIDE REPEAT (TPR)-LIKE SUPERFAMILY PROTEIN-RELATED [Salix viminalis]|uniref:TETRATRICOPEPTIDE REPEAT (TPR)-LIKE SUPERFAMILY PROTEIN-RELATED n=1 Tax=Salix viminalis TaxID=40686 RepID=A0A9Q0NSJ3_SALVM|nr:TETRATRICOPEPTIDE REPEAT (TPR)-LIKE SUPERFAMILY PROTEIN-RELATED [Salix viminalis]